MVDAILLAVESYIMCGVHDKVFISMTGMRCILEACCTCLPEVLIFIVWRVSLEMCRQEDESLYSFLTDLGSIYIPSPSSVHLRNSASKQQMEHGYLDAEMQSLMKVCWLCD